MIESLGDGGKEAECPRDHTGVWALSRTDFWVSKHGKSLGSRVYIPLATIWWQDRE